MTQELSTLTRAATPKDVPQIHAIYTHYVNNTITDLHHKPPSLDDFMIDFKSLLFHDMVYLVATDTEDDNRVLGFIHAFPFRGYKLGYAQTIELAIMCKPDAIRRGVGSVLMGAFLVSLQKLGWHEQILAFMTVLEDEVEDKRVKSFYEKWGFHEVGIMTDVARKFDRKFVQLNGCHRICTRR